MNFKLYETPSGDLKLSPTLRALLTEDGAHIFNLAFETDPEQPRNHIFGVVLVRQELGAQELGEDGGWGGLDEAAPTTDGAARCSRNTVYLCYELCEDFPLFENGEAFARLQKTIGRILAVQVRLLPFTKFQRSAGLYPSLLPIFRDTTFAGLFRDKEGSFPDLRMNVVLARWQSAPFASAPAPPGTASAAPAGRTTVALP